MLESSTKGFIEKIFNDSNVWSRNWWQFCVYSLQLLLNEKAEALLQEVEDLVTVPVDRMTSQGSPRSLSQLNDMDIFSHSFSSQWESFDCRKINLVHLRLRWCNFCSSSHSIIYADIRDSIDKNKSAINILVLFLHVSLSVVKNQISEKSNTWLQCCNYKWCYKSFAPKFVKKVLQSHGL